MRGASDDHQVCSAIDLNCYTTRRVHRWARHRLSTFSIMAKTGDELDETSLG